jgi:hypothetical protein
MTGSGTGSRSYAGRARRTARHRNTAPTAASPTATAYSQYRGPAGGGERDRHRGRGEYPFLFPLGLVRLEGDQLAAPEHPRPLPGADHVEVGAVGDPHAPQGERLRRDRLVHPDLDDLDRLLFGELLTDVAGVPCGPRIPEPVPDRLEIHGHVLAEGRVALRGFLFEGESDRMCPPLRVEPDGGEHLAAGVPDHVAFDAIKGFSGDTNVGAVRLADVTIQPRVCDQAITVEHVPNG